MLFGFQFTGENKGKEHKVLSKEIKLWTSSRSRPGIEFIGGLNIKMFPLPQLVFQVLHLSH
jgi:hypothetical protein